MARCDYCKSFILFGGRKKSGRTFCNDECLQEGRLMMAADRLPQYAVDDAVNETHQGKCSLCKGPGPIDVHTSHTIWSIVALTSWKSTPYVCCRSCGRQKQLSGFVTSGLFGWWGFPWGFIYTPIQLCRNLSGIIGGPDSETPSEQLETLTRLELAIRVEAGEPLPNRRNPAQGSKSSERADDRISVECEDCGKSFKAKVAMAGKTGKCPGCGSPITVPHPDEWSDDDVYETEDEWGGDSYGDYDDGDGYEDDNPYAGNWEDSSSPRRSSGSRTKRKPRKKKWTPLKVGLVLGLGFAAINIFGLLVVVVMAIFEDAPEPQFGQNNPIVVPQGNPPENEQIALHDRPEFQLPDGVTLQPNNSPPLSAPNLPLDNPADQTTPSVSIPNSAVQTPPVKPLDNVDQTTDVWVVLSNLRPAPNAGPSPFNKPFVIDYQLASGSPAAAGKYVLHLSKQLGGGNFYHTVDVPIELKASGTVDFKIPPQFGPGTDFVATIALPAGPRKWKNVSGELAPGGTATTSKRPPTIRELAGASAQGKVVAIANPVFASGSGPFATLTVDFDLQQQIDLARYYMLVAETSNGKRFEFDVKFTLQRAKVGDEGKFNARLSGPVGELKPPFRLHVEKRTSRFPIRTRPETPEVVSNKINVAS